MMKKLLLALKHENEEDQLREPIFVTPHVALVKEVTSCNMFLDSGSCRNMVSREVVDNLKLNIAELS